MVSNMSEMFMMPPRLFRDSLEYIILKTRKKLDSNAPKFQGNDKAMNLKLKLEEGQ